MKQAAEIYESVPRVDYRRSTRGRGEAPVPAVAARHHLGKPGTELSLVDLEASLGITFSDRGLLRQALVHRSYLNEHGGSTLDSYERMEFLGDAVLELIVSTELYQNLPRVAEGELTKGRSSLVCRASLARAARRLSLGKYLSLGKGEMESGGNDRESIPRRVL